MTGQAKNTAYELSNTAEFAQIEPKQSASRRNAELIFSLVIVVWC